MNKLEKETEFMFYVIKVKIVCPNNQSDKILDHKRCNRKLNTK